MYLGHLNPPKAYFLWSEKLYLKKGFDDSFFLHNYMDFIVFHFEYLSFENSVVFKSGAKVGEVQAGAFEISFVEQGHIQFGIIEISILQ